MYQQCRRHETHVLRPFRCPDLRQLFASVIETRSYPQVFVLSQPGEVEAAAAAVVAAVAAAARAASDRSLMIEN